MEDSNKPPEVKPAGSMVLVGAVPGALIISNEKGEVIAFTPKALPELISALQRMAKFAETAPVDSDGVAPEDIQVPLPAPAIFYKRKAPGQ